MSTMSSITKQKHQVSLFKKRKKERKTEKEQRKKRKKVELLVHWSLQEIAKILKPVWSFVVSPGPSWTPD